MDIIRAFEGALAARLEEKLNFIQVVLGPRQVGKTTGVKRVFDAWKGPKLFASADLLTPPDLAWLERQWLTARQLGSGTLLVIDEVQKLDGWSNAVKKLFDEDRKEQRLKVVLLGSASLSLARGLSDSLAGRFEVIDAPHWSYHEVATFRKTSLNEYLIYGGYPAALDLIADEARWARFMKDSIIEPVISRDLQGSADIRKPALFRQTFELVMNHPAQEISLNKLLGQLQDSGNVTTIKYYLELLQAAFLIKVLEKFSTRRLSQKTSSPKLLPLDNGLVTAYSARFNLDSDHEWRGRLFETAIGAELSRRVGELFYWREKNDEVDYIFKFRGKLIALEVKSGRRRVGAGLNKFISLHSDAFPILLDLELGERFLAAENPMDELMQIAGLSK